MKTHGVTTVKFQMGNTIFVQDFIVCDDLVRPIIIGRDFTVSNYKGHMDKTRNEESNT